MKTKFLLLLAGLLIPLVASAQIVVTTSYSSGTTVRYDATSVTTSGTVVISGTADVSFVSDARVTLAAGFKVAVGATFRAKAGPDVDGDGLPNSWENTYGLNLLANDAAGNPDGDGFSNLLEYQLGTNPTTANSSGAGSNELKVHRPN